MIIFLQRWARDRDIRFKLFNPSKSVRERLESASSLSEFDMPTLEEMVALLLTPIADTRLPLERWSNLPARIN